MNKFLKIVGAVAVINMLARFFGFLREIIIGVQYGTTFTADSIINAYTIPNFLYLVIGGAFTTAFISIFHKMSVENQKNYIRRTFTTIVTSITIITIFFIVFSEPILHRFFQEVSGEEFILLKSLYMWMMPSTIMLVLSTWLSGVLNVQGKFNLSSFSVLVYNLSFLVISVGLSLILGPVGYGIGALLGAVFMVGFLVFGVRKVEQMSFKPMFESAQDQKELWKVALPIMLGGATAQMYILIQRFFTSGLQEGAVSAMNYATKVSQFPQGILMTAVTTVIFPMLSKKEAEGDRQAVKDLYIRGLRMLYLLVMPISIYVFFQSEAIVRIVFEYGNFDTASTAMTAPLLQIYSLTMFFLAANTYITRFYYAKGNSMIPVIFSLVTVFGVNIAVIYAFIDEIGADAIAWGVLVSSIINFVLLVAYLQIKYKLLFINKNISQFIKFAILTVCITVVTYFVSSWIVIDLKWMHVIVTSFILLVAYIALLFLLKFNELNSFMLKIKKKVRR